MAAPDVGERGAGVVDDAIGDRDRLAALFVAEYDALVRLARLLGDPADAEDVVQSAFVRVYRRGRLRDPGLAGAYLRQTVVNLTRSGWRRRSVARRHAPALVVKDSIDPDLAGALAIRAAIGSLPTRQREAVVLRYYADLSEADTAEVMGVAVGSVKGYTSRGLAKLGELMAGERP
jgi:RNA polymerase sigma-70 factor (sigma-E family)